MNKMRTLTIICWIITAVVLAGLVIWFITGSIFGGWFGDWDNFTFGVNIGNTENLSGPFEKDGEYTVASGGLDSIKINWVAGDVTVKPHDGTAILITELAQRELKENEKLRFTVSGNTLEIKFLERGSSRRSMPPKKLEVLIPHTLNNSLDLLLIDTVSGAAIVNDINASTLNFNTTSGRVNVINSGALKLIADTTSGDINTTGAYNDVNFNTVSGRITLENSMPGSVADADTISGRIELSGDFQSINTNTVSANVAVISTSTPEKFKADTVSGDVTITLPSHTAVSVNHSSVSGRFTSEIPVLMEGRGAAFNISTVSGNTNILSLGEN